MMGENARVVVLMSPGEKQALHRKAARAGNVSAGELVRRAVDAYDETAVVEAAELRRMTDLLAGLHRDTLERLDATERKLDDTLAHLRASGRQAA